MSSLSLCSSFLFSVPLRMFLFTDRLLFVFIWGGGGGQLLCFPGQLSRFFFCSVAIAKVSTVDNPS